MNKSEENQQQQQQQKKISPWQYPRMILFQKVK
jgi:hypothetical protein